MYSLTFKWIINTLILSNVPYDTVITKQWKYNLTYIIRNNICCNSLRSHVYVNLSKKYFMTINHGFTHTFHFFFFHFSSMFKKNKLLYSDKLFCWKMYPKQFVRLLMFIHVFLGLLFKLVLIVIVFYSNSQQIQKSKTPR